MKLIILVPCLMLENNRAINQKALAFNKKHIPHDEFVIYDQCFNPDDYIDGFTYIGKQDKRMGWVEPRNALLRYFYNSDYDYALWIDANSTVSTPTLNDVVTVVDNVRNGTLQKCDSIFATLGMWVSGDRIAMKSADNYLTHVGLIPNPKTKAYNWMHGLIHKNFKKYYNQEFYIDERCDTKQGTPDDVYFARVLNRYTASYVAPTIVLNKPNSKASCTWANEKGTYDYPPVLYETVDRYIFDNERKYNYRNVALHKLIDTITLPRSTYMQDKIREYKPRTKKAPVRNVPNLFWR